MSGVFNADIFIIPNCLQICEDHGIYGYDIDNVQGLQVCFEGWITSDECENWCRHGCKLLGGKKFSDKFPIELFIGKKEGDVVELLINDKKINVTCRQQPYRYGNQNFEDMMYTVTQSFGGVCAPTYFNPPLSERSQRAMILVAHERYTRSLNLPTKEPMDFKYASNYIDQCKSDSLRKPYLSLIEVMTMSISTSTSTN